MVILARESERVTSWQLEAEAEEPDFVILKLSYPDGGVSARFRRSLSPNDVKVAGGFSGGGWHWHLYGITGVVIRTIVFDTSQGERAVDTLVHADFPCRFWYVFFDPLVSVTTFRLYNNDGQAVDTVDSPEWFESSRLRGIESTKRFWDERLGG